MSIQTQESKPGEYTPAPQAFPQGICEHDKAKLPCDCFLYEDKQELIIGKTVFTNYGVPDLAQINNQPPRKTNVFREWVQGMHRKDRCGRTCAAFAKGKSADHESLPEFEAEPQGLIYFDKILTSMYKYDSI